MSGNALFDTLVGVSGLAPLFASAVVARACIRAGLDVRTLTRRDIPRALPALEQALRIYLPREQVPARLDSIARLERTYDFPLRRPAASLRGVELAAGALDERLELRRVASTSSALGPAFRRPVTPGYR